MTTSLPRLGTRANAEPIASPTGDLPPIADFSSVVVGNTVTFTDQSVDLDGTIVSYQWDFGDAAVKPVASFTVSGAGLMRQFLDQSTDAAPGFVNAWLWAFGDGATSIEQDPSHTYAAGGNYTVSLTVTDNDGNASSTPYTQVVSVSAGGLGVPFIVFEGWGLTSPKQHTESLSGSVHAEQPENIVARLRAARLLGQKFELMLCSGTHTLYMTNGQFDRSKWSARLQRFNTPAIRTEMEIARAAGVVLGLNIMDEPQSRSWRVPAGPSGITRAVLNSMAAEVKSIFGSLMPVGCHVTSNYRPSDGPYTSLDYIGTQFIQGWEDFGDQIDDGYPGTVQGWRDWAIQNAFDDGKKVLLSLNILNGGAAFDELTCAEPPTGGISPSSPGKIVDGVLIGRRCSCGTIATGPYPGGQVAYYLTELLKPCSSGTAAGTRAVGLQMWQWNLEYMQKAANKAAFATVAAAAALLAQESWR